MPCITPPSIQNPFLHNSVVSNLQLDIINLSWLEDIFPLAEVGELEIEEGNRILIPMVLKQDGSADYIPLFPDDQKRSGMFFELETGDYAVRPQDDELIVTVNLIFYGNLKRIANRTYDFTDELIQSVLAALRAGTYGSEIVEYRVIKDKNRVFDKYGYTYEQLKQFAYPYTGFKIQIDIPSDYSFECNPTTDFDQSYSPSCP
jgi:hypothetical protein